MATVLKRRAPSRKRTAPSPKLAAKFTDKLAARSSSGGKVKDTTWLDEVAALVCYSFAIFVLVSFLSYEFTEGRFASMEEDVWFENPFGPVGRFTGAMLSGFLGWCAVVPALWAIYLGIYFWHSDEKKKRWALSTGLKLILGLLGVQFFACTLAGVSGGQHWGGLVGTWLSHPLEHFFGRLGAALISAALLLMTVGLATNQSLGKVLEGIFQSAKRILVLTVVVFPRTAFNTISYLLKTGLKFAHEGVDLLSPAFAGQRPETSEDELPKPRLRKNAIVAKGDAADDLADLDLLDDEEPESPLNRDYTKVVVKRREVDLRAVERQAAQVKERVAKRIKESGGDPKFTTYEPPDLSLLARGEKVVGNEDDRELREISRQIESKLGDFGITGRVTHVHPGPVITLFEFEPAAGVKVGRIAALQDDLAMSLRASSIRIIAPIPQRGTVGIEVPNRHRNIVRLRDVLESEAFVNAESVLSVPVGKDIYGDPVVVDIAQMPHLLMAGATGTGKSVCINAILLSLLYRAHPSELGLILIDPKILELSIYDGIPHLRVPVVTMAKQAKAVLDWAANEMNRRYRMMQRFGVRNIDGYNRIARGEVEGGEKPAKSLADDVIMLKEEEVLAEGTVDPVGADGIGEVEIAEKLEPLPKIVIVIDELADLMLTVGRDIEELITRLAQKARAAGIHLIIATQRPSVDVITGLIKANFPARLSFRVSSRIDSRTILDQMGADKLLGRGDMLFMLPGAEAVKRVHGAFVSDAEVKRVVEAVKAKCQPNFDQRIMDICEKALEEEESGTKDLLLEDGEYDAVYDRAVELVMSRGQASTSMLQRAFRIGYNRAARIIDMMEKEGIVGPMDGAKPREVLTPNPEA